MKNLLCLLGFHDWEVVRQQSRFRVNGEFYRYEPPYQDRVCMRKSCEKTDNRIDWMEARIKRALEIEQRRREQ